MQKKRSKNVQVQLSLERTIFGVTKVTQKSFRSKSLHVRYNEAVTAFRPTDSLVLLVLQNLIKFSGKHLRGAPFSCARILLLRSYSRRARRMKDLSIFVRALVLLSSSETTGKVFRHCKMFELVRLSFVSIKPPADKSKPSDAHRH